MSDWAGFWIFLAIFVSADTWIFSQGYDSVLREPKTTVEIEIQRLKIDALRQQVKACSDKEEK